LERINNAALVETNSQKLRERIRAAKSAIDNRLHELQMDHGGTPEERQAITAALDGLNCLRRELQTLSGEVGPGI
jgi:hypothetical protein